MTPRLGMCGFTIGAATYYRRFPVVEVQQTFYDPPANATIERWRAQAPPDFEFTMKAWQLITHLSASPTYRRLKTPLTDAQRNEVGGFRLTPTVLDAWDRTLECAALLRATGILFQCPASFRPTDENVAAMREFFAAIDRPLGGNLLWEPRGPSWPDTLIRELCNELSLVHAVDPFVRRTVTPESVYWRLHGNGSAYARYTDAALMQLHAWIAESVDRSPYVLFNNVPRTKDIERFMELGV